MTTVDGLLSAADPVGVAIAAMLEAPGLLARTPYAPLPYECRGLQSDDVRDLRKHGADLDGGARRLLAALHRWQYEVGTANMRNRLLIEHLCWAIGQATERGQHLDAVALRSVLHEQYGIAEVPEGWLAVHALAARTEPSPALAWVEG